MSNSSSSNSNTSNSNSNDDLQVVISRNTRSSNELKRVQETLAKRKAFQQREKEIKEKIQKYVHILLDIEEVLDKLHEKRRKLEKEYEMLNKYKSAEERKRIDIELDKIYLETKDLNKKARSYLDKKKELENELLPRGSYKQDMELFVRDQKRAIRDIILAELDEKLALINREIEITEKKERTENNLNLLGALLERQKEVLFEREEFLKSFDKRQNNERRRYYTEKTREKPSDRNYRSSREYERERKDTRNDYYRRTIDSRGHSYSKRDNTEDLTDRFKSLGVSSRSDERERDRTSSSRDYYSRRGNSSRGNSSRSNSRSNSRSYRATEDRERERERERDSSRNYYKPRNSGSSSKSDYRDHKDYRDYRDHRDYKDRR